MIVLHKAFNNSDFRHGALVVALEEEAPLVAKHSRLQDEDAGQRGRKLFYGIHRVGKCMDRTHFRILSPAKVAAGTFRNCCSSWSGRFSPPLPPQYSQNDRRFLRDTPPSDPVSSRLLEYRVKHPSVTHASPCPARPFHAPLLPPLTGFSRGTPG